MIKSKKLINKAAYEYIFFINSYIENKNYHYFLYINKYDEVIENINITLSIQFKNQTFKYEHDFKNIEKDNNIKNKKIINYLNIYVYGRYDIENNKIRTKRILNKKHFKNQFGKPYSQSFEKHGDTPYFLIHPIKCE